MRLTNNKLVIGSLVLVAVSVAYYLLIYLPKQQELRVQQEETTLRKQTYELCLKEYNEMYDSVGGYVAKDSAVKQFTKQQTEQEAKQEMVNKLMFIINKKDEIVANCVEKRLGEYRK